MPPILGTGTTITFDSGFFAEIVDTNLNDMSREPIRSSHFGTTTGHTFIPADLVDFGELEVEIHYDPDLRPPIDDAAATCTITVTGGATLAGSMFMTNASIAIPFEEKMMMRCTLKVSGDLTWTPAA